MKKLAAIALLTFLAHTSMVLYPYYKNFTETVSPVVEEEIVSVETTKAEPIEEEYPIQYVSADSWECPYGDPVYIRCTAYIDHGITASGTITKEGRTLAGKREWIGKTALLYSVGKSVDEYGNEISFPQNLIGLYTFEDTGYGINGSLIDGTSIDVFRDSMDGVYEWMSEYGDYVYMYIIDAKG